MPSIRYYNATAPFWDFVANLESQGQQHPFFAGPSSDEEGPAGPFGGPRGWGQRRWHRGPPPMPHRFRHNGPPPVDGDTPMGPAPPAYEGSPDTMMGDEKEKATDPETSVPQEKGKEKEGEGDPFEGCQRGAWGRRGWHHGGPGARFRRGGRGGWGHHRGGFPFVPGPWGAVLNDLFGDDAAAREGGEQDDFKPDVDVFDMEDRFIVHVSLPGAKKEDVGVNWDAEKSEIQVAGVTYRPAEEDVIKTLALDERKVGAFERKVRLGSRANPAQVDAEAISAKLENGILVIEVPKLDKDYVEVKKVDVE